MKRTEELVEERKIVVLLLSSLKSQRLHLEHLIRFYNDRLRIVDGLLEGGE